MFNYRHKDSISIRPSPISEATIKMSKKRFVDATETKSASYCIQQIFSDYNSGSLNTKVRHCWKPTVEVVEKKQIIHTAF